MEQILVVPRDDLFRPHHLQGFSDDPLVWARFLEQVEAYGRFVDRASAEQDTSVKQIVPYGVVLCREYVFLFRRERQGAEAGLRGRWSIGLGGHVNPQDGGQVDRELLQRALLREISEEVSLDLPQPEGWGVLNDDTDPVGLRHFGFVYRVWVASPAGDSREPGKIQGRFVPLDAAATRYAEMETWSRIIWDSRKRRGR